MNQPGKPEAITLKTARTRSETAHVGVAALERGLTLLCVLDAKAGLSLSEAARRAGLNKTTAFRLMRSLARNGFVSRGEDELYRFGERLKTLVGRRRATDES